MATPDWEAIESAYRAGVLSLRDIGDKYGVTEGAIRKRAKKFGWVRKAGTQARKNGTQGGTQKVRRKKVGEVSNVVSTHRKVSTGNQKKTLVVNRVCYAVRKKVRIAQFAKALRK